jgi:hypothetical protein
MLEVTIQKDAFQILGKKLKAHFPCRNLNDAKGGSPLLGDGLVQTDSISLQNRSITIPTASMPQNVFTLAFWLKHGTAPTGGWDRPLLMRQSRQPGMWLYDGNNAIHMSTFLIDSNGGQYNCTPDNPSDPNGQVHPDVWTHVLYRFRYTPDNGVSSMSQFINGIKIGHGDFPYAPQPAQSDLTISTWYPCNISDIRTYGHYLSDIECGLVYAQSNKLKPTGS